MKVNTHEAGSFAFGLMDCYAPTSKAINKYYSEDGNGIHTAPHRASHSVTGNSNPVALSAEHHPVLFTTAHLHKGAHEELSFRGVVRELIKLFCE